MNILYFGTLEWGSTSLYRMEALRACVDHVYAVDTRMLLGEYLTRSPWRRLQLRAGWPPLMRQTGSALVREAQRYRPDVVWIDQGITVGRHAIEEVRCRTSALCVHYTPDAIRSAGFWAARRGALAAYDLCITTKPDDLDTYRTLGARRVLFTFQGFEPRVHRPVALDEADRARYGCDVAFAGQRRKDRARSLQRLVEGVPCAVHLYGRHWERGLTGTRLGPLQQGWVFGDAYAKAICGAKISLAFLQREVFDRFTTRSFEIPACGGFMLAERTELHQELFEEDREAVFFGGDEELCDKVMFYLAHDDLRRQIARAGYDRAWRSGYTWEGQMRHCLRTIQDPGGNANAV